MSGGTAPTLIVTRLNTKDKVICVKLEKYFKNIYTHE